MITTSRFLLVQFVFLLIGLPTFPNEHTYGGAPTENYLERNGYIIEYDLEHKVPKWVAYHAKPEYLETPERTGRWASFRDDPDISGEASEDDYTGQFNTWRNYAKGHLVPYYVSGGDRDGDGSLAESDPDDQLTVYQINYMSNIAPQDHYDFNGSGGLWYELETYEREVLLREQGREIWVFAGTIYGPGSYDSIGDGVEVPPLFYRIIVFEDSGAPIVFAFLFPHQRDNHGEISDFLVPVDLIEALTGLDFFREIESEEMERVSGIEVWEG